MVVAGVIAEYNPFHRGHRYQYSRIREITGADYIIAAMSGNFVQRGTPAVFDKYTRVQMALSCGADLVLELPAACAVSSAETFARGGFLLLKEAGITHLAFGAECTCLSVLRCLAWIFDEEPAGYRNLLQEHLHQGLSYPGARSIAAADFFRLLSSHKDEEKIPAEISADLSFSPGEIQRILREPNNILAIEYLKAIRRFAPEIVPVLIPRIGEGYHSEALPLYAPDDQDSDKRAETFSSASAVRSLLFSQGPSILSSSSSEILFRTVPEETRSIYRAALLSGRMIHPQSLDSIIGYCLCSKDDYEKISDFPADLANRIRQLRTDYDGFESFCEKAASKNFTQASVRRALLHLLLSVTREETVYLRNQVPYLRVLGFRRSSARLLSQIVSLSSAAVITSVSDFLKKEDNSGISCEILKTDLRASEIYRILVIVSGGEPRKCDLSEPMVIL